MLNLTESDLDRLIDEKLRDCNAYHNICELLHTETGRERIKSRLKQIIYDDGITSIEAALTHLETELIFS